MTSRQCLRDPIPEIEIAARRLDDAVSAHLAGDRETAEALLRLADDRIIRDWLDSVWGKASRYAQRLRVLDDPPPVLADERASPRFPAPETKHLVHQRDGFYCRFCKIPVIRAQVRRTMCQKYPGAVPWGRANATQHAAFQCMWAQYDHVVPHARGGSSDLENICLACAACNYGRGYYLLEEQDLMHPLQHAPRQGDWDGLERVLRPSEQLRIDALDLVSGG